MVISTKGTKAFVPKHTSNYNAETVANTQSIFLPDASTAITTDVSVSIQFWLRKRGQAIQTPMTEAQKKQLKECFELIDTDGSGSLDLKEMFELFDTMGLPVDRQQIEKLVSELDDDGSGEIEFGEFMAIMQKELYDSDPHASVWKDDIYTAEDRKRGKPRKHNQDTSSADPPKKAKKDNLMPLNLLAGAYRRKKVLDAVMGNTGDMRKRLIASGHEMKEKIKREQSSLNRTVEDKSKSWRQRTQQKKVVEDRLGESETIQIDVLDPLATPRSANAEAEDSNKSDKPPAPKQEAEQAPPSLKKQPSMKEPAEGQKKLLKDKKAANLLWKEVQANEQLGQAVGAAIVVKRDLHKREEIRERIEFRTRRKPAFSEDDRKRLEGNDKLLKGIQDDEMRSLLLAGVIPRSSVNPQQRPETEGGNPYMRQSFGQNTVSDEGFQRPSTVPAGFFRPTPAKPQQISEALAYRPVPKESEIPGWNESLEPERSAESAPSPRDLRSRGGLRQPALGSRRGSLPPRGPCSRPHTRESQQSQQSSSRPGLMGSRPASQGRDLLLQRQSSRDSSMRSNAMMRHRAGHALEEAQAAMDRPDSMRGHSRKSTRSWRDAAASSPIDSHGSPRARPDSPGFESTLGAEPSQDAPVEEPWVSPWTGRIATPIAKTRGLELDARISARNMGTNQPGVPVWKKSNAWLPAGGRITKPVRTLPTDDDRAAMADKHHSGLHRGRAKAGNRHYGRSPFTSRSVQSARSAPAPPSSVNMMLPDAVF